MNWLKRTAVTTSAALAVSSILGTTIATQAHASSTDKPSATSASGVCHYRVNGNRVAVRRLPDTSANVLRSKNRGARVTGPCIAQHFNDGRWWTPLYLSRKGYGWTASVYLVYRGCRPCPAQPGTPASHAVRHS